MVWYIENNKRYRYPHYSAGKAIWKTIWLGMNIWSLSRSIDRILAAENKSWSASEVFLRLVEEATAYLWLDRPFQVPQVQVTRDKYP